MPDQIVSPAPEASAFREPGSLEQKIERARTELLDLSTRNRLLHTPRGGRAKTVEVIEELAQVMYQTLVVDGKRFTFAAGRADPAQPGLVETMTRIRRRRKMSSPSSSSSLRKNSTKADGDRVSGIRSSRRA